MKVFRYIGIICLAAWNTYYHPIHTKTDVVMIVLFWVGIILFIKSETEDK